MKLLPCSHCGKEATLKESRAYPSGEPYLSGRYVGKYACRRCSRTNLLSVKDWNRLPDLSLEDFRDLAKRYGPAVAALPTRDIEGLGLAQAHAEDLFRVGLWDPSEIESMSRENESERQWQDALSQGID